MSVPGCCALGTRCLSVRVKNCLLLGTITFLILESLLLLRAPVNFCAGSSTAAAEPPDCCPAVLEGGQVCNIDISDIDAGFGNPHMYLAHSVPTTLHPGCPSRIPVCFKIYPGPIAFISPPESHARPSLAPQPPLPIEGDTARQP